MPETDWRSNREMIQSVEAKVDRLTRLSRFSIDLERMQMASLEETLAKAEEADTKTDSIIALLAGMKAQLAEALSGVTLPPAVQAKVDAVFNTLVSHVADVDAALVANTPEEPAPPVDPPVDPPPTPSGAV